MLLLKAVRIAEPDLARWSFTAEQQVLRRLEKAFAAFFGRIRRGAKAGFPRFRSRQRYHTANFCVGDRDIVSSVVIHYRAFGHMQVPCIKALTERIAA